MFVKTFVFSICDYLLYLQPLTDEVQKRMELFDLQYISFILSARIKTGKQKRASFLARTLPVRARRQRQIVKAVAKFRQRAISTNANDRYQSNWDGISNYSAVNPLRQASPTPSEACASEQWLKEQHSAIKQDIWEDIKNQRRKIPTGKNTPSTFTESTGCQIERKAVHWYLNRIPWAPQLSAHKQDLRQLLEKENLTSTEVNNLGNLPYIA